MCCLAQLVASSGRLKCPPTAAAPAQISLLDSVIKPKSPFIHKIKMQTHNSSGVMTWHTFLFSACVCTYAYVLHAHVGTYVCSLVKKCMPVWICVFPTNNILYIHESVIYASSLCLQVRKLQMCPGVGAGLPSPVQMCPGVALSVTPNRIFLMAETGHRFTDILSWLVSQEEEKKITKKEKLIMWQAGAQTLDLL